MAKIIQYLIALLAIALPLQTVLSQLIINSWKLPESLNLWKEVVVGGLMLYFAASIARNLFQKGETWHNKSQKYWSLILISLLTIWIVISGLAINQIGLKVFVIGFRFELWWLWFFVLAHNWLLTRPFKTNPNNWKGFYKILDRIILAGLLIVVGLGITVQIFGPEAVLPSLGFSSNPSSISPPVCHLIDFNQTSCRLAAGFSSPNHLAAYLILVWPVTIWSLIKSKSKLGKIGFGILNLIILIFISLSYARFSWLAVATGVGVILTLNFGSFIKKFQHNSRNKLVILERLEKISQILEEVKTHSKISRATKIILGLILILPIFIGIFAINLPPEVLTKLPAGLAKPSSTALHYMHTMTSLDLLKENPQQILTGFGIGSSGPAAKADYYDIYNAKIIKENAVIPYRWGLLEKDLTIPESWYLQLIINGGIIYALLYLVLVSIPVWPLLRIFGGQRVSNVQIFVALAFFGILIGNLFLHVWESQSVALYGTIIWIWLGLLEAQQLSEKI